MRRIVAAAALVVLGSLVSAPAPAQAASGPWSGVSAGHFHTCAINSAKSLYCWGYNPSGQIGDGTTTQRPAPKRIGASGVWASVAAGGFHTCAITTGKSLYCWGNNESGQIGDGTTGIGNLRLSPKKIGASGIWAGVATGGSHTCAVTTGRSLYCWGRNDEGQIGDGTTGTNRISPKKIGASGVWASVAAGALHTCAVTTGKSLYCWGYNEVGSVGDGTSTILRPSPRKVGASGVWSRAAAGDYHTCAITTGKSLYCWGLNQNGQIGDGTFGTNRLSPKKIGSSGVWARVSPGGYSGGGHTCATTTGNSLYCWGYDQFGQVGVGATGTYWPSPKKVGASGVWADSAAGGRHTCAISAGKSLYCWGNNDFGQVGDGTTGTNRPSPKKIP